MFELLPILMLGLGLGLIHALDADHIMTMSVLNSDKPKLGKSVFFSMYWAMGHSIMLLCVATLLFSFGITVPEYMTDIAEIIVGMMLVGLGCWLLFTFKRKRIVLEEHSHGNIVHRHWHDEEHTAKNTPLLATNAHKPVLVGLLHSFAGSAPAIALIPALAYNEISLVFLYLGAFSMGVMLAMLGFGLGFSYCQRLLSQKFPLCYHYNRQLIALASICVGCVWLTQTA